MKSKSQTNTAKETPNHPRPRRAIIGKAKIKFVDHEATYPYCTYRKSDHKLDLYNVVFTNANAKTVTADLPYTYLRDQVMPTYKLLDERNKVLFDSKWDKLTDYLDI